MVNKAATEASTSSDSEQRLKAMLYWKLNPSLSRLAVVTLRSNIVTESALAIHSMEENKRFIDI